MPDFTQFRTSLNGYNREDVVAFIDQMTKEHEETVNQLEEKNAQLRSQLEEAEEALAAAGDALETEQALSEANNLLVALRVKNEVLEKRIRELEASSQHVETQEKPVSDTVGDLSALKAEKPVPAAPEQSNKDYAEMELAAYRRAELVERRARERANDIYRGIQTVFAQASSRMGDRREDLEQLSETMTADFNRLLTLLTDMNKSYQSAEDTFADLEEKNRRFLEGEE